MKTLYRPPVLNVFVRLLKNTLSIVFVLFILKEEEEKEKQQAKGVGL